MLRHSTCACQHMPYNRCMPLTNDKVFQMRATAEFLRRIDDWRRTQPDLPSRAEAVRRLTELGLTASKVRMSRRVRV